MGCSWGSKMTAVVPDRRGIQQENVANTQTFQDNMKFIARIPLFQQLPSSEIPRLADQFQKKAYRQGETIVTMGDVGEELFLIRTGEAKVNIVQEETFVATEVAKLKQGDYFGESALIHNATRNATVVAHTDLETLVISRERFDKLDVRKYIAFHRRAAVAAAKEAGDDLDVIEDTEKDNKTSMLINQAIRDNKALNSVFDLSEEKIKKLVLAAKREEISAGEDIIKEGDYFADKFYIVETGKFDVTKVQEEKVKSVEEQAACVLAGAKGNKVASLGPGNSFGELALLYNAPRASTVTAVVDSSVWAIHRKKVQEILKGNQGRNKKLADLIDKIPFFSPLLTDERMKMVSAMTELYFKEGEVIIKQHDEGDSFFLLYEGTVRVWKDGEAVNDLVADKARAECPHFGERALLENEPRNATVTVVSKSTVVFCIKRKVFDIVLGPLAVIMEKAAKEGDARVAEGGGHYQAAAAQGKSMKKIAKADLETVGLLGAGGFGAVSLQMHKTDKSVYALKAMSKGYICKLKMQSCVINEKAILMMTDSFFIIKLYACYNSTQSLYFLLEPCLGGELFATYNRQGLHGKADCACFYVGSVIEAFIHLHERHVIYRDLKPENCLLTQEGYCKLADMGLAKFVIGQTYTTCGTPDYFAPEILLGTGHNTGLDWWTLGVFIYELLDGVPPFDSPDVLMTYQKIKSGTAAIRFNPKKMPTVAINLIKELLKTDSSQRLPCRPQGFKLLKDHPWFRDNGLNWEGLNSQKIKPPYEPGFDEKEKLKNFSCREQDLPPQIPYTSSMDTGWDEGFENIF